MTVDGRDSWRRRNARTHTALHACTEVDDEDNDNVIDIAHMLSVFRSIACGGASSCLESGEIVMPCSCRIPVERGHKKNYGTLIAQKANPSRANIADGHVNQCYLSAETTKTSMSKSRGRS